MSYLYQPKKTDIYWLKWYENGIAYRRSLKTRDKALAKYLQNKKDIALTENKTPSMDPAVQHVLDEYDRTVQTRKTKSTHYRDMQSIRRFINTTFVQKIGDITEKILQDYFNKRAGEGIAVTTLNRNMASLKTFLHFALRRRYIFTDPSIGIRKYPVPEKIPAFFRTKEDINNLLKTAKKTDIYPAVATAIYTGMRQGELFTLDWKDIDFHTNTITVQNTERHVTKSKKFRVIPIHSALKSILKPLAQKEGQCFDITNHRRIFGRIMKACGQPKDWRVLRHTFASQLVMAGVDIVTVKELMGHASISTTMIYSHLSPAHAKNSVGKLDF